MVGGHSSVEELIQHLSEHDDAMFKNASCSILLVCFIYHTIASILRIKFFLCVY